MKNRYLFIRILEACNAGCFMCGFSNSKDQYRFTLNDFEQILLQVSALDISYIRLTGGEPLLHKQILDFVRRGTAHGMKMSIITNGRLLPKMICLLADAGLAQIIVSLDGATAATHDTYRNTNSLFDSGLRGLEQARDLGVLTRVNTVVGPHNYAEMRPLQATLTDVGVQQWELSALKLNTRVTYRNPEHVLTSCEPIYQADPISALIPMGKRFYGDTIDEQRAFFQDGILPHPTPPHCHLIGDVLYLDAKAGRGFGCSILPHRDAEVSDGGVPMFVDGRWNLNPHEFAAHIARFRFSGPSICRQCSTTAAGYSDDIAQQITPSAWHF